MKYPIIWDGTQWRKSTKKEYEQELINVPVYGKANFLFPSVWNLPVVDTNIMTGSKVVDCGRSVQFRFSCAKTTDTAKAIRAYKLGLDKDDRAGVRFNYSKTGSVFTFQTTFCGSLSGLKKFDYNNLTLGLVEYLRDTMDIKSYNKVNVKSLDVVPDDNIYGVKVIL